MIWLYLMIALLAGAFMPLQAGVNAQLTRVVGHPVLAALVSFTVGTFVLFTYSLSLRSSWPTIGTLIAQPPPWWVWTGGLLGAFFVATAAALAPKLGAATFTSITVASQMIVSVLLDHYGLIGFQARPLNPWRALGATLLIVGVVLIRRF